MVSLLVEAVRGAIEVAELVGAWGKRNEVQQQRSAALTEFAGALMASAGRGGRTAHE